MGLEDGDAIVDDDGGKVVVGGSVSCSICLDVVSDTGDRSWAKLQCGHQFHLDCIGSAFNVKGVMQCPNCRKIEKGQWLFANGCRPYQEFSIDDWAHDEDLYELSVPETPVWCPYNGFARLAASFDEGEFPTTAFHPSSSSSTSSASVADGPTYNNNQWNSQSASSEMPNSYGLPTVDVRYHTLFPTSNNGVGVGGADQPSMPSIMPRRPARTNPDMPRSGGSYVHPFIVGQSSAARAPSAVGSSMIHPYPGSAARARERNQALQAYFQQPSNLPGLRTPMVSGSRRSNSQAQMGQVGSSSDQIRGGIYYLPTSGSSNARSGFQEAESSMQNTLHHMWERDPQVLPYWDFHQAGGGGGRSGAIFRQRHGSERAPSQGHYRS